MRKLGKSLLMILMLLCMFSYMGVANALEASKLTTVESSAQTAIEDLLSGKTISGTSSETTIQTLLSKYTMAYKIEKIDSTVYDQYKANTSGNSASTIANLVNLSEYSDFNNLTTISEKAKKFALIDPAQPQVSHSDLELNAGYLVVLVAQSTSDQKLYEYRGVYQATTATTLATYNSISKGTGTTDEVDDGNTVDKDATVEKDENVEKETEEEEKAESNPETGISDFAMYIVPFSLVAGSALMIKRRHA